MNKHAVVRIEFWASIGLILFFFLPWLSFAGAGFTGYNVADCLQRWHVDDGGLSSLMYLIPVTALVAVLMDLCGIASSIPYRVAGVIPLAAVLDGTVKAGSNFWQSLSVGAYLSLAAGLTILVRAVMAFAKRGKVPAEAETDQAVAPVDGAAPAPQPAAQPMGKTAETLHRFLNTPTAAKVEFWCAAAMVVFFVLPWSPAEMTGEYLRNWFGRMNNLQCLVPAAAGACLAVELMPKYKSKYAAHLARLYLCAAIMPPFILFFPLRFLLPDVWSNLGAGAWLTLLAALGIFLGSRGYIRTAAAPAAEAKAEPTDSAPKT